MGYYSYILEHDYGLAPNPFGGYCTLVVCKADIRKSKNLAKGDWIFGTGSKAIEKQVGINCNKKLIYAMRVDEKINMNDYWHDLRFQYKKPIVNGSKLAMFGDNFYHINDETGEWVQENSPHSKEGSVNQKHLQIDVKGKNALISSEFFYFGSDAIDIPVEHEGIIHATQGMKCPEPSEGDSFLNWLYSNFETGIHGMPCNWSDIKNTGQISLF